MFRQQLCLEAGWKGHVMARGNFLCLEKFRERKTFEAAACETRPASIEPDFLVEVGCQRQTLWVFLPGQLRSLGKVASHQG